MKDFYKEIDAAKNFRRDRGYIFLKENQNNYYYADNVGSIHIIPKGKLFLIMNLDLQDEIIHKYGLEREM